MSLKTCGIAIVMEHPYDYRTIAGTLGVVDTEANIGYAIAHDIIEKPENQRLRDYEKRILIGSSVWQGTVARSGTDKDDKCNLSINSLSYGYERSSIGVVLGFDDFGVIISLKNIPANKLSADIKPGYAIPNSDCYVYDMQNREWKKGTVTDSSDKIVSSSFGFKYNITLKCNSFTLKHGCSGSPVLQNNRIVGQICAGSSGTNNQTVYATGIMTILDPKRLIS